MKKRLVLVTVSALVVSGMAFATVSQHANPKAADTSADALIGPNSELPTTDNTVFSKPGDYVDTDYPFEELEIGMTWYDYQHNGGGNKMIAVGDDGNIHICWMKGFDSGATERHTVYGCVQSGTFMGGNPVDNTGRSGYNTLDVLGEDSALYPNAAVVAFHQQPGVDWVASVAPDFGPCWMAFLPFNHPVNATYGADQPIWTHVAVDNQNQTHIISTRPDPGQEACYDMTADFSTWQYPEWHVLESWANVISATPTGSNFDNQVALMCFNFIEGVHPAPDGLIFSQSLNDIWLYVTDDGDFGDFTPINLTDFVNNEDHPLSGRVYAYCDIDGVFDLDGNLHVVYSTRPYWANNTIALSYTDDEGNSDFIDFTDEFERWSMAGQVWHAMRTPEGEITYSHVAGYVGDNDDEDDFGNHFNGDPGGWGSTQDRPSIAIDPDDGTLYCMWRDFTNLPDTSATGMSNADLWVRASCDAGATWGPKVNITDTQTPGCAAGDCSSEAWATMAEIVYDGNLHVEFVEDKDAGGIPQEEGAWTENPVWYMAVPTADVPCGDAWDAEPFATRLSDTWYTYNLPDSDIEYHNEITLLNEGAGDLLINSIEMWVMDTDTDTPTLTMEGADGSDMPSMLGGYETFTYAYDFAGRFDGDGDVRDELTDIIIRFNTNGGEVDFRIPRGNPLNEFDPAGATATVIFTGDAVAPTAAPVAKAFELAQNYPNPFNPTTAIEFTINQTSHVTLDVHNVLGQTVATLVDGLRDAASYSVTFDASSLPSGVYFYRLTAAGQTETRKMTLIK